MMVPFGTQWGCSESTRMTIKIILPDPFVVPITFVYVSDTAHGLLLPTFLPVCKPNLECSWRCNQFGRQLPNFLTINISLYANDRICGQTFQLYDHHFHCKRPSSDSIFWPAPASESGWAFFSSNLIVHWLLYNHPFLQLQTHHQTRFSVIVLKLPILSILSRVTQWSSTDSCSQMLLSLSKRPGWPDSMNQYFCLILHFEVSLQNISSTDFLSAFFLTLTHFPAVWNWICDFSEPTISI